MGLALGSLFLPWRTWFGAQAPAQENQKRSPLENARRLLAQNRLDQLVRLAATTNPKSPDAAAIYALAGQACLAKGDVANAKKAFERSLELKLEQPEALNYLAAIYLASGDSARGLALLELSARLKPDDFQPWLAMGKVRQDMGELELASTAYEECLKRNPPEDQTRQARLGQIRALIDNHKEAEAQPLFTEAIKQDPANPALLGLAAIAAQTLGQSEQADPLADQTLAIDPNEPNALLAKAQIAFLAGNAPSAEAFLKKALTARPNQPPILQLLMQAQARQGKTSEAAATKQEFQAVSQRILQMDKLTKRISQEPDNPQPRFEMGLLAVEGKMKVLAEQCFKAALDINPAFNPARKALEQLQKSP
jgi:tetratricopeptide (TPR) repeat protein